MQKRRFRQVHLSDAAEIAGISSEALAEKLFIDVDNDYLYYIAQDGTPTVVLDGSGGGGASNLSIGTITGTTVDIDNDNGTGVTVPGSTKTTAGLISGANQSKLDDIEANATANSTDAHLLDRANHTGTQSVSTVDIDNNVIPTTDNTRLSGSALSRWSEVNAVEGKFTTVTVSGLVDGRDVATDGTKLDGIESGAEVNNISDVNATDLTDAGDSTLHYHSADRNRANHTGTQTASTISDFQTEVSNNTDVSDNTSKLVYRSITVSNTSGTTSIAATAKELVLNDTIKTTGTGDFTVSGNEITIKNAGDYVVSYNTSLNSLSGSNRSGYRAYLQQWNGSSWTTLTETTGSAYVRGTGDAEDAYGETEITAAVNDRIHLMAVRVSGSATNTFQQNGFTRVTVRRSV